MASILNATTSSGLVTSADNSGSLQLATNNGTTAVTIDTSQNVGIGTASPATLLHVYKSSSTSSVRIASGSSTGEIASVQFYGTDDASSAQIYSQIVTAVTSNTAGAEAGYLGFETTNAGATTEKMRITSDGDVCVGKTAYDNTTAGIVLSAITNGPLVSAVTNGSAGVLVNRLLSDGDLVIFRQSNTTEGTISVSGTTVSYNGGHLARWSQLFDNSKDESLLKGTVLSNLDEMCVWEKDGVIAENEQLNKMKVSDVEGDTNVAGVFVNWTKDDDFNSDDMNIAMTGDMIIRIAQGVTVQRGDLLMSAGDGTAKPQGDDIVRSKTVAKVTSTHVTCTYADGSYCVPCVLMAC
jgi:hypothetical protein